MILLKEKVKAWLGPIWWYSAVMFCVQRFGDVINLYTGLWLIPKWVSPAELGALLPLTQIGSFLGLPLAILLTPFAKFINTFGAKGENGKVKALVTDAFWLTSVSAVIIGAYTWFSAPLIFARLRIGNASLAWLLCGVAVTSVFMPIMNSALQALKLFRNMGVAGLTSAPVRLVVLLLLLPIAGLLGYFFAQMTMNIVILGVGFWGLRRLVSHSVQRESYYDHLKEMVQYTLPVAFIMSANTVATTVQYFVIRQRLPDIESAAFYFCSRFSELPSMLWSAFGLVFFPFVSEAFERGGNTRRLLFQTLSIIVLGGGLISFGLGFVIEWIFGAVARWRGYVPYAYLVVWMSMTNVFGVAFACFSVHEMACRRFGFVSYSVLLGVLQSGVLLVLTGYGFFEPYLPMAWVNRMGSLHAAHLGFVVGVMLMFAFLQFLGVLAQILYLRPHAKEKGT